LSLTFNVDRLRRDDAAEPAIFHHTLPDIGHDVGQLAAEHAMAHPLEKEDFEPVYAYWTGEMIEGDAHTRGNILQTVTACLDPFTSGDLRKLFCTSTT
jgi:hypothetical protein